MDVWVIDANVLIRGGTNLPDGRYITCPKVYEELKSVKASSSFEAYDLSVESPDKEFFDEVLELVERINAETSEADIELVALGLEMDGVVLSDDMGVQNLCLHLDIDFDSFLGETVDEKRVWKYLCESCGREVDGDKCGFCGGNVMRKEV